MKSRAPSRGAVLTAAPSKSASESSSFSVTSLGCCLSRKLSYLVLAHVVVVMLAVLPYILAGFIIVPPAYFYHYPHHRSLINESHLYMHKIQDPQADFGLAFEDVEFPTADGSILRGWLVAGSMPDRVIVATHGATEDRRQWLKSLTVFTELGFHVLLYDCREHGLSDGAGRGVSYTVREHEDVLAAVDFVASQRGFTTIVALGTSQGASSSLLAAVRDPRIVAVIAENPFCSPEDLLNEVVPAAIRTKPRWGAHKSGLKQYFNDLAARVFPDWYVRLVIRATLWRLGVEDLHNIEQQIARISPRPILIMHSKNDTMFSFAQSERLFAAAGEPKELWLPTDAAHARIYNMFPSEWKERVQRFLRTHVLSQSGEL